MNLKPAPQDAASWLPDVLEVMDRNARLSTSRPNAGQSAPAALKTQTGEEWSDEEDLRLIAKVMRGVPRNVIAAELKRPVEAIYRRSVQLRKEGAL